MAEPGVGMAVDTLLKALATYEADSHKALHDTRMAIAKALGMLGTGLDRSNAAIDAYAAHRRQALANTRPILRDLETGQRGTG